MDAATRSDLLGWAQDAEAWIVEDDRDADAWFDSVPPPAPLAAQDGARTVLVGSFNRLLFPGLCVAFLVAPLMLVERLRSAQAIWGGRASLASQLALAAFIGEGHLARHLRRRRQGYADRRAALLEAMPARAADRVRSAGLHLSLRMTAGAAATAAARLAAEGLGGAAVEDAAGAAHLLLGLGATPEHIRAAAPRLAAIFTPDLFEGDC